MKAQNIYVWILSAMMWANPTALAKPAKGEPKNAPEAAASPSSPSEKLDVSDLETKYWAPKDTDFSVVQNRTYSKEKKIFISTQFGPDLHQSYLTGNQLSFNGNYFFNERFGLQATYMKSYLHSSAALGDLAGFGGGIEPNHGQMTGYYGVGFNWVPFYSKMSFLGKKILYFDMAITPTIGMTQYDQVRQTMGPRAQEGFTYGIDVTQYYFFSSHWAVRVDWKNQWYREKVAKFSGTGVEGDHVKDQTTRHMSFLLGFSFYFGK